MFNWITVIKKEKFIPGLFECYTMIFKQHTMLSSVAFFSKIMDDDDNNFCNVKYEYMLEKLRMLINEGQYIPDLWSPNKDNPYYIWKRFFVLKLAKKMTRVYIHKYLLHGQFAHKISPNIITQLIIIYCFHKNHFNRRSHLSYHTVLQKL